MQAGVPARLPRCACPGTGAGGRLRRHLLHDAVPDGRRRQRCLCANQRSRSGTGARRRGTRSRESGRDSQTWVTGSGVVASIASFHNFLGTRSWRRGLDQADGRCNCAHSWNCYHSLYSNLFYLFFSKKRSVAVLISGVHPRFIQPLASSHQPPLIQPQDIRTNKGLYASWLTSNRSIRTS